MACGGRVLNAGSNCCLLAASDVVKVQAPISTWRLHGEADVVDVLTPALDVPCNSHPQTGLPLLLTRLFITTLDSGN